MLNSGLPFIPAGVAAPCSVGKWADLFIEAGDLSNAQTMQDAREHCYRCPYIRGCREYAIETRQTWGIWGGMDETQREYWLKRRAASVA